MALQGGLQHPVVTEPTCSRYVALPNGVALAETGGDSPGVTFPEGFEAAGISAGLKESGKPDVGIVAVVPEWRAKATSAALFTTNAFAAAPVELSRSECDRAGLMAVVVNSGNANACTGTQGLAAARSTQMAAAKVLGVEAASVAIASTGMIGVQVDEGRLVDAVESASANMSGEGGAAFAKSIMTTDRFEKMCAVSVETSGGVVRIGACAKGAGMIAPAMATMLCFVTTDAELGADEAEGVLRRCVDRSFNAVTVDGEMSTNDSVFLVASGASGVKSDEESLPAIERALEAVLLRLALMMVADGEGATKIMRLRVRGAGTEDTAVAVARAVADSPLVKTAMHGCDPNWGRIVSSTGAALAGRSLPDAALKLCGVGVFAKGVGNELGRDDAERLAAGMQDPEIDIDLDLGLGDATAEVYFADMGHEYITINAEYHS